jgi:Domain of unknown function (DU1801)
MAEPKTRPTTASVVKFLDGVADQQRRKDCFKVLEIMKAATKSEPEMWGTSIVGFGRHNYKYESGTKGEWFLTGFSPRKQELTLYLMGGSERHPDLLKKLGKHKTGRACLYIKKLDDIDLATLKQLIERCIADIAAMKKG